MLKGPASVDDDGPTRSSASWPTWPAEAVHEPPGTAFGLKLWSQIAVFANEVKICPEPLVL